MLNARWWVACTLLSTLALLCQASLVAASAGAGASMGGQQNPSAAARADACAGDACVVRDAKSPYFRRSSQHKLGDKGDDPVTLRVPRCAVFDHAELSIRRSRFAGAQFIELPAKGCERCAPVVVRWYYEPTGYLEYEVDVYWRDMPECKR